MKLKPRLIISLVAIYLAFTYILFSAGVGAYTVNKGKQPLDFEELTISDVKEWRAVKGDCYVAYDLIGYTEKSDDDTTTTTDYYWLVDCGDNDLMLLKTSASDDLSDCFDDMVDLYWDSSTWEDYAQGLEYYAEVDGVFIKNDSEIVDFYNEWIAEMSENDAWKDAKLAPCTLDCTRTYSSRITSFRIGTGMIVLGVLIIGIIIFVLVKATKSKSSTPAYAPAGNYGNMQGGSYDPFTSNPTAPAVPYGSPQNTSAMSTNSQQNSNGAVSLQKDNSDSAYQPQQSGPYSGFQSQQQSTPYGGFQSQQQSTPYSGFQPQQQSTSYSGFQPQQTNTPYNGYQPQGGSQYAAPSSDVSNGSGNNF